MDATSCRTSPADAAAPNICGDALGHLHALSSSSNLAPTGRLSGACAYGTLSHRGASHPVAAEEAEELLAFLEQQQQAAGGVVGAQQAKAAAALRRTCGCVPACAPACVRACVRAVLRMGATAAALCTPRCAAWREARRRGGGAHAFRACACPAVGVPVPARQRAPCHGCVLALRARPRLAPRLLPRPALSRSAAPPRAVLRCPRARGAPLVPPSGRR
jgi:hypothetical protein